MAGESWQLTAKSPTGTLLVGDREHGNESDADDKKGNPFQKAQADGGLTAPLTLLKAPGSQATSFQILASKETSQPASNPWFRRLVNLW